MSLQSNPSLLLEEHKKERKRMCKIYFRNLSWVWGVDRKIQACRVMQDYDLEGRIFRSTCHARKILFLAYFVSYLKSNPFDCWHLPYFDNISVMLNDSINFSDVNLNDGVPLDSYTTVHIKSVRNLKFFILPWITFHFLMRFQYMYLREPVFGQFYRINSGILGRYTWYILGCRMKVHK